jgi:aminoglycoside/choline kinase family phosphotransferase
MQHDEQVNYLFFNYFGEKAEYIEQLAAAGSDRIYFRVKSLHYSAIACYGSDSKENQTFIHHAQHFKQQQLSVPQVYCHTDDFLYYLQEDLGNTSLYDIIRLEGVTKHVEHLYKKAIDGLIDLQIKGAMGFNFDLCYPIKSFDKSSMFWDMNAFKYYFVRMAKIQFNEVELNKDFHALCDELLKEKNLYFMYRDCQARNIMIHEDKPYFIDFQGGRKGAPQYDLASLLWQAGAKIPMEKRIEWLDYYIQKLSNYISINKQEFKERYYGFVLIRMLQVLGAYGFRGLIEKKPHFIESINPALENIKWFLDNRLFPIELKELEKTLYILIESDLFTNELKKYPKSSPLSIEINSFSFKRAIPEDKSGNGGGFVFDCRGILNPGRYEPYKNQHGKDKEVIDFLEQKTKVKDFLENIWRIIDINIEDYILRNFEHLQINFGCTGGQHRSVYCAEQTKKYIESRYPVKVTIRHIEREMNGQYI